MYINTPVTARVKISQNVDILAKEHVYLVHVKVEHCQNLRVASNIYRSKWVDRFWLALSYIVEGGQDDGKNQSTMHLCAHLG